MRTAEIIAVGSELLTPEKTDTNSLWLTEKLDNIGIEVMLKTIVGDDEARLEEAIKDALKRSDLVVTTGGLGPTDDDVTRQVSARAIGRDLVYHEELEQQLRDRFRMWGREMPEINKRQAYVVDGADILPNPNGSAVGMFIEVSGKNLVVLPGPPREMRPMFEDRVMKKLQRSSGTAAVTRRVLRVVGMGESAVDEAAAPIYNSIQNLQTSILFNKSEVEIHLSARSVSPERSEQAIEEAVNRIVAVLGKAVFTTNNEKLEEVVMKMFVERDATLSLAESCTGGLIAARLTDVAGSSRYFLEGAVTYSNEAKIQRLAVARETIEKNGAVSSETAEEMAAGIRKVSGSTHSVSVTGIAGPEGGTDQKPVGTVYIGYSGPTGTRSIRLILPGDRYLIRWRTSSAALDYLRRQLLKESEHQDMSNLSNGVV